MDTEGRNYRFEVSVNVRLPERSDGEAVIDVWAGRSGSTLLIRQYWTKRKAWTMRQYEDMMATVGGAILTELILTSGVQLALPLD